MRAVKSSRWSSVVGAVGAAVLGVALAAAAAAQASAPPSTVEPSAVPDGYQWVEDDTHTIGIAIPDDWTVNPVTAVGPPGKLPIVAISASAPGPDGDHLYLEFTAYPVNGTPQPWDPSGCDPTAGECPSLISTSPYDNGSFAGYRQTIEGCCASGIFDEVEANAHDGSLTIDVHLNFGSERDRDEVALFETILGTVARVGAPMPAVEPLTNPIFPYDDFGDVPQLGNEPVRGTGCGANGQIGETIPDGTWAGFVTVDGDSVGIDLLCVYTAQSAEQFVDASDHVIWTDGDSTVVDNNERVRTMPAASDLQLRDALFDSNGNCVEAPELPDLDHSPYPAWLNIEGGAVTWVVWGCAASETGTEPAPEPPTTPQPAPTSTLPSATSSGVPQQDEAAALAADCEYAQRIIWEGDMYVGVEFPPEGSPITGDFLSAVEASRDFFEYDRTQVRSELAQDAFANHYAVWSDFLDGGTFTRAGWEATVQAGFDAVAPFQRACGLPTATR
jgi:hypothetical protein